MSRQVIHDIVIPIVSRIMSENGFFPYRSSDIMDGSLEEFLEEAMRRRFGVIGANDCQHLREQLVEALRNDPYSFDLVVRQLLDKYVNLAFTIRRQTELHENGPPDRFSNLRKRYSNSLLQEQET